MKEICHVVGAGDFSPNLLTKSQGDIIIAADNGLSLLEKAGIQADFYIGDGDSLGFTPTKIPSKVLPCVKDDTDTVAALREGLRLGYRHFRLYGALGGKRLSHSIANLQSLSFLWENGAVGQIIDENVTVSYLTKGQHRFSFPEGYFSLFPLEGEATVSVEGARYPLEKATLTPRFPLGVSNEGTENTVILVHSGSVYLIREV